MRRLWGRILLIGLVVVVGHGPTWAADQLSAPSGLRNVQDEGSPLIRYPTINFFGAGITCTPNAGAGKLDCSVPGGAGVGGTVGTTNEVIPVADGVSGGTLKASTCTIVNGKAICPNGFEVSSGSLGGLDILEGTAPGAPTTTGVHRTYIDSITGRLTTHKNAGTAKDYVTAADVQTLTNKLVRHSYLWEFAGCDNGTAGPVFNKPATNAATPACDVGTNIYSAYLAFNDTTDQGVQGSFILKAGYSGAIDWPIRYKMASATSGTVGICVRLVRLPTGAAGDPAFPAQSTSNCASQTVPGTAGFESVLTLTNVTCTSCVAGDRVFWLLERDANASAVSDTATGDLRAVIGGPIYASVE